MKREDQKLARGSVANKVRLSSELAATFPFSRQPGTDGDFGVESSIMKRFYVLFGAKMRNNKTFLIVWALTFLTASASMGLALRLSPSESKSASEDYFYCVLIDESQSKRVFFTAVFSGDNSEQLTLEERFSAFVSARYSRVHGSASCRFDKSRSAATTKREDDKIAANREGRPVIETNWRP